ncbi:MAG: hypothetical protein A3H27_06600 [Acidobacteria bacterium RIFCSPLOWO2_02_FULL_59_13]|nr:MAG: hypothetical protein A3H27_06600 [Acidobacteria bacterium RIFCSPLOWO2_02_FULL_59_13]
MKRLVESWTFAEWSHHHNRLAAAIRILNKDLGMNVTHSRVSEWRRGVYVPSQAVLSRMLLRTLPWALKKAGIQATENQIDALENMLWKFNVTDGQRHIELL